MTTAAPVTIRGLGAFVAGQRAIDACRALRGEGASPLPGPQPATGMH